ncbi:mitochondrial carrier domain-containing protein [Lentinula boryana]|uniref:Mitochondrial carrier domain-containing protein n=1 Tax=Lentinula boryana TaxID=40481 RepID=A0ABQ8QLT8_9AGAR|nr:mitochondrial carrier domain-containing protein [Lentinula boryana]
MASEPLKTSLSEAEPLLTNLEQTPNYSGRETPIIGADVENQPEALPDRKRSPWEIAFYVICVMLGIILLAMLIKGFIEAEDVDFDFGKAFKSALGGGLAGAAAMVLQVLLLMARPHDLGSEKAISQLATKTLYREGGYRRYYQGLTAALVQGPISRFGDTAANVGILVLLESNSYMKTLPALVKTLFASVAAAVFRMTLTPIDTIKTTMQTQGQAGLDILKTRIKRYGIGTLWYGALATAAATFVGHYPWFGTYNFLQDKIPVPSHLLQKLLRQALIGFAASVISDTVSNSLRVLKTYRQVNETRIGYLNAAKAVINQDGLQGLFGRGLKTRILANGLQGLMFSVLWKLFLDLWNDKSK